MKVTCELCETVLHLGSATVVCVPCLDRLRSAERPDTAVGALPCGAPNTASAKLPMRVDVYEHLGCVPGDSEIDDRVVHIANSVYDFIGRQIRA